MQNNKTFATVALIVAVGLIAAWIYFWVLPSWQNAAQKGTSSATEEEQLVQQTDKVDLGNLDSEFQAIDADLNRL